jgi:hypothetical protein
MAVKNIEKFFLDTLLKISIVGVSLVFTSDLILYPDDQLSVAIDFIILSACFLAFLVRRKKQGIFSIFIVTLVVLSAMFYQCMVVPVNTTTSLSIILIVGFIFSVMLKGTVMWVMHAITFTAIHAIFFIQFINPDQRFSSKVNDVVTVSITYSILYFILTYATGVLKAAYDKIYYSLRTSHVELHRKNKEIAEQNEKLMMTQENLNALNTHLEGIISERTEKIQAQNEVLLKYSYTNAHHLRGPVARLLGLASIYRMDSQMNPGFILAKMEEQANEIDAVVKKINIDLDTGHTNGKPGGQ